ncbi:MAG: hypothetical protein AABZ36_04875 [Nitrospirota bacterium]
MLLSFPPACPVGRLVGNPSSERFWTSLPAFGGAEGDQGQNDRMKVTL